MLTGSFFHFFHWYHQVVLKPDIGVGAASTHKIPTAAALASWFSTTPNPEYYIAQPFINAPIVTFDGFAGRSGDVLVASSVEYSDGVMEAVNEAREIFFYETRELDPALLEMGRRIVKDVLGLRERWFHIEFFRTAHGYMMLEANLRPPGVWIPKMIGYATGTDPFAIYAGHLRSEERGGMATPKHTIAHITRRTYNHSYRLTKKQLVKHFGENLLDVLEMPEVFREALGEEGYIIRVEWTGQGREEERKAVLGVAAIVQEHGVPEPEDEEVEETEETAETDAA